MFSKRATTIPKRPAIAKPNTRTASQDLMVEFPSLFSACLVATIPPRILPFLGFFINQDVIRDCMQSLLL